MKTVVVVASLCILAVCVLGQNSTSCLTNRRCHDGFLCSADQDEACIDRHCTCLTTHTCTRAMDCRDINACQSNFRHHEVCHQGKCHCADITDIGIIG